MHIEIEKEIFLNLLTQIAGPTLTKQSFPALGNVLIKVKGGKIKCITTDLEITEIVTQAKINTIEEGITAIPLKRLLFIIKELPFGKIKIQTINNNMLIKCGKINYRINGINPKDFPKIEEPKQVDLIRINYLDLEEMIKLTSFCVSNDEVNYVLGGILFELEDNKIKLIATDGKRMAYVQRNIPADQSELKKKISFILPQKAVLELQKIIKSKQKDVFLFIKDNLIGFDFQDIILTARPIEGEFPNYNQYIPQPSKNKIVVNRKAFLQSLRRANILSTQDYQGVKLILKKNQLTVFKATPQLGEVKEEIEIQYKGSDFEIGFNPVYIIDVLKNMEIEDVEFEFYGVDKPMVLRLPDYVYLVSPMRL